MKRRKDRKFLYESIDGRHQNEEGDYFPKDFADWREIPSETLPANRASSGSAAGHCFFGSHLPRRLCDAGHSASEHYRNRGDASR